MDAIRLYSAQVPDQVKKVVRILVQGSAEDVEDILPIELRKIDRKAEECLKLAQAAEAKFEHVMDLTAELLEVSPAAKGYYKKSQEELEIKRKMALAKEEAARKKLEDAKEQKEKLEKQVKEAKAGWEKAVGSMPSGWGLLGMQLAETLTHAVSDVASIVLLPVTAVKRLGALNQMSAAVEQKLQGMGPSTQQTPTVVQAVPPSVPPSFNTENLMILITKLVKVFSTFQKGSKETKDERSAENEIVEAKIQMQGLKEEWSSKEDRPDKEKALQLLTRGLEICSEAETLMTQLNRSPEEMEEITKQASNLKRNVRKFCTKAKAKAGKNPFYTKPPRQARNMANSAISSSRVDESAIESALFKIAEARSLLERQEDRYDQTCKEVKEGNEELSKVLQSLAEFRPEKTANFDQIRETLIQGIKALASVREQWQKLVEFFQFITNIIKVCQKESLSSFVEYAKVGQKRVLANGYASTDFMRDLIYEQVSQASTTSYVVWSISNTYVEISRDHLMSRIASLGHLIALDPEKDRAAIEAKRNELMEGSQEAQEAIRKHVSEANDQFHIKVAKRIKKIETELLKALPLEDPAKIKEINDFVKNAIKEADEELDADKF